MASRPHRIAHWAGIVLASPIMAVTVIALVWWWRGEFPPTVTVDTVSAVLALAAAAAALVYLTCRGVGWAVSALSGNKA